MNNDINYSKNFTFGGEEAPDGKTWAQVVEEDRQRNIQEILSYPAVVVRGKSYYHHLVEVNSSVDPSVWAWKETVVRNLMPYEALSISAHIGRIFEAEKNRGPVKPITRHTSS